MDKTTSSLSSANRPGSLFGSRAQAPTAAAGVRTVWPFKVQVRPSDGPGNKVAEASLVRFKR